MKKDKLFRLAGTWLIITGLITGSSCTLEDQLVNPSALTPDQAGNEFIFNGLQLNLGAFFLNATQFGMDNTRMLAMGGGSTYENAYSANNFNGLWFSAYSDIMVNANLLLSKTAEDPATPETEYNGFYQGTAKIMKAYVMITLVDYFGDVPYSKAFNVPADFNPAVDDGADIYAAALALLNSAIADLASVDNLTLKPSQDLYYAANSGRWIKFAKTLKMKAFLQTRLVNPTTSRDSIAALIAEGDMISSVADEFTFKSYGNSQDNPNTYHPWFFASYQTSAGQYMSNSYMYELYDAKSMQGALSTVRDPRLRFYFYRQTTTPTTDVNLLTCVAAAAPPAHYPPGTPYCQLPAGYWGRDHLNFEGTPPDGLVRTIYGLYPAGGAFDQSQSVGVDKLVPPFLGAGAGGRGILPIMMYSFVRFMTAEYLLTLQNNPAAARVELEAAIRESINRVVNFAPQFTPQTGAVTNSFNLTAINNYVNRVLLLYDGWPTPGLPIAPNATLAESQLDVIVKEYRIALWGNGIEAYNTVRRTGKPSNLQPALTANPGDFYRSFIYPAVFVIRNNSVDQKPDNNVQVFWDTNPAGFIK